MTRRLAVARRRLFRHPQWNIGVLRTPPDALLGADSHVEDDAVDWFPLQGRRSFLADPFAISRDGTLHILCEEFDYRTSRGRIRSLRYAEGAFELGPIAELPVDGHASYPFLVEDGGEVYCVPETSSANEVALYRATSFPERWERAAVLVAAFAGVDPTLFRHDDRWWLACTQKGPREDVDLLLWQAPALLGPWTQHVSNPVKSDVAGARPGGRPFLHDGALYRPAQDCSRRYGWRIVVQRVTTLTPAAFAEEPASVLEAPARSPFPLARHTLTPVGDFVLVDGCRERFVPSAFRAFLKIWLSSYRGRRR